MLCVPYFEKRLYELPAEQVTPEGIAALADEVVHAIVGLEGVARMEALTSEV